MPHVLTAQMYAEKDMKGNEPIFMVEIATNGIYLATQTITTGGNDTREDGTSRGNSGFGATDYTDVLAKRDFFGFINYSISREGGWSSPSMATVRIVNNEEFSDNLGFSNTTPYPCWENDKIEISIIYDDHTDLVYTERQILFTGVIKNMDIADDYITLGCVDHAGEKLKNTNLPKKVIEATTFDEAPEESIGLPIPIAYGDMTMSLNDIKQGKVDNYFSTICIDEKDQLYVWAGHETYRAYGTSALTLVNDAGFLIADTTFTVDDGTTIKPYLNDYIYIVDTTDEIVYVSDVNGNVITITRAQRGTAASAHADDSPVYACKDIALRGERSIGYSYACNPHKESAYSGRGAGLYNYSVPPDCETNVAKASGGADPYDVIPSGETYSTVKPRAIGATEKDDGWTFALWVKPSKVYMGDDAGGDNTTSESDAEKAINTDFTDYATVDQTNLRAYYLFEDFGKLGSLKFIAPMMYIKIQDTTLKSKFCYEIPDRGDNWAAGHTWTIAPATGGATNKTPPLWNKVGDIDVDRTYAGGLNQADAGSIGEWNAWDFGDMHFLVGDNASGDDDNLHFYAMMLLVMYSATRERIEEKPQKKAKVGFFGSLTGRAVVGGRVTERDLTTYFDPIPSPMYVSAYGRIGGAWMNGRNSLSTGDLIETPEYIIESILRDELSFATAEIDITAVDAVYSATYKMAFSVNNRVATIDLINKIALQGKLRVYSEPYNDGGTTVTSKVKISRYSQTANFTNSSAAVPALEDIFEEHPGSMEYYKTYSGSLINDANGITNSDTTIVIDDETDFSAATFILIDREIMYVSAVTGDLSHELTVTRGQKDTTAIRHEDNARIYDLTDSYSYTDADNWHPRVQSLMTNPIVKGSLSITKTSLDNLANQVTVKYKESTDTGNLKASTFVDESDSTDNDLQREKIAVLSQNSTHGYGMVGGKEIEANMIRDATTAESLRDHIFDIFSMRRNTVTFRTFFNALHVELGDVINIRHRLLQGMFKVRSKSLAAEAIDSSETGIDVDDGDDFEAFKFILIEDEIMKTASIAADTLTVERGCLGTTAVAHADNSVIYHLETFKVEAACDGATGAAATDTGIDVTAGPGLGTDVTVYTYILIGSEIMFVTATAANSITVVRGMKGTTMANHADTTAIYQVADYLDKKWEVLSLKYLPDCTIELTAAEL